MDYKISEIPRLSKSDKKRFWLKVKKTKKCWVWMATLTRGYGSFWVKTRNYPAHRVSLKINKTRMHSKKLVCHKCDNRRCIKPSHLFLGTHKQNTHDMIQKNRQKCLGARKKHIPNDLIKRMGKWTDQEIADAAALRGFKCDRKTIWYRRRQLLIPTNPLKNRRPIDGKGRYTHKGGA